jgi:hypothetical protein
MIAKPPVTSVEQAFPPRPFLLPGELSRESSGETLSENAVVLLLKNVCFPGGYFANTMPGGV